MHRRAFLSLASIPALALRAYPQGGGRPSLGGNPFKLGVASGEPTPDGVVLWTRLALDPLNGGGMPNQSVDVRWQVASDDQMRTLVRTGIAVADPQLSHSVHVEVEGLDPDRWYWYRFVVGDEESPIARTRTTPALDAQPERLRFAFASCQHYETGYFTAFEHMAAEDPDLIVHLGDYIYEGPANMRVRAHQGDEIKTIEDYRNRHALYRSDPDLQKAHAVCPWLVTWDDHEVDNNYAARISEELDVDVDTLLTRRAHAYQAYYEHMPLRAAQIPHGADMRLYRHSAYGRLAQFAVLDTRQYRSDQPCGDRNKTPCEGVFDPAATVLGAEQEKWLFDSLERSPAAWNVLAQQIMMARVDREPGEEIKVSMDQWSGYDANRKRVLKFLGDSKISNPVVLTGDIHSNWVNDLKVDFDDEGSPTVASEFVGTSISSGGDGSAGGEYAESMLRENPFVKLQNAQRGYVSCEVTAERWTSSYRVLDYVSRRGAPRKTLAEFVVESGRPGPVPA